MTPAVRFAPSPTGKLHVGNIRAAIFNKLFALKTGGSFMLRMDDTDQERSSAQFAKTIEDDLACLGLTHDRFARQSDRIGIYDGHAERLKAEGKLYPCYESAEELERRRKRQIALGKPPVYDRAALRLSPEDRARAEGEGRRPHWRLKLSGAAAEWHDLIRGPSSIKTETLSDPVLIREDGRYLYTFASVIDDIDFGITHIIRGEDHVTNTAVQLELFRTLGGRAPEFAHFALLVGAGGEALSKRIGSLAIEGLRAQGIEPEALLSLLAKLGTADAVAPRLTLAELAEEFDFSRIGRAPAHFDPAELLALNARVLHIMPYARAKAALAGQSADLGEAFWLAIRDNLETLKDAAIWAEIVTGPIAPQIEDGEFAARAADLLPAAPLSEDTWAPWTKAVGGETGRKGRDLFQPLRLALTGRPHGPEMKKLLPLIGRERAESRLRGKKA
ncbi:MAG: glutamate--tRNA ligase [Alphaproteobacteria bacterium]|nr:glutamate--tRNA ligase [Alphaproteobacteria bacterium]